MSGALKRDLNNPTTFTNKLTPFAFAGLGNMWEKEAGIILSFTIITKEAEESVKPIHWRMLFVLNREHYGSWLVEALSPGLSPSLPYLGGFQSEHPKKQRCNPNNCY